MFKDFMDGASTVLVIGAIISLIFWGGIGLAILSAIIYG